MNYTRQVSDPVDANGNPFEAYVDHPRLVQYRSVGLCNLGFAVLSDGTRTVNALLDEDGEGITVHERALRGDSVAEHVVDLAEDYGPWDHVVDTVRAQVRREYGHVPDVDPVLGPRADDPAGESGEQGKLSLDECLRVLSNRRRRRLVRRLSGTESVDETVVPVVVSEDLDGIERVVVQVYNVHLPVLAGKGIVEWDREGGVVRRGPEFDAVSPLVDLLSEYREGDGDPDRPSSGDDSGG